MLNNIKKDHLNQNVYIERKGYRFMLDLTYKDRDALGKGCFMGFSYRFYVKRGLDLIFSLVSLMLFFPLMVFIYLAILVQRDGKVIFRQERIGKDGKPFLIYKFRTMVENAEVNGVPRLSNEGDSRLTPVGKFLREHHLDELPQLWNVVKGDMSFVGYRPERRYFIEQIMQRNPEYTRLFAIRPGLFSEATLYNGYTDTMEKMLTRLKMDLDYLDHCSSVRDFKIIWATAFSIIIGKKF